MNLLLKLLIASLIYARKTSGQIGHWRYGGSQNGHQKVPLMTLRKLAIELKEEYHFGTDLP